MKIAIAGASGTIGRQLVPRLAAAGADLLLAGRDPARLAALFPGCAVTGYDRLSETAADFDMLLHLAVRNNDRPGPMAEFMAANVDFLGAVLDSARAAGIRRLVYVSSLQALDPGNRSAYAQSKRAAVERLRQAAGIDTATLYLPIVYGERFSGRLRWLDRLPRWLARAILPLPAALKPTLHMDRLAAHVLAGAAPGILTDGQESNPVYLAGKRLMDIGFALVVLVGFCWLLVAVWIAVRLSSPGPAIFSQTRVGRQGRPFTCYKFRTMAVGTRQAGTHELSAAAVTRLGRILRRTKLDELPQAVNLLKGEMSLVGPRPCLPMQETLLAARAARDVLRMRPGITGLAQIEGIDMSEPARLAEKDAVYGQVRTLLLDIGIALRTFLVPLRRGAARPRTTGPADP